MASPRSIASHPALVPTIAGLICAAAVAWFACPIPPRRPFTTGNILGFAAYYTLITAAACAVAVSLIQAVSRREIWRISAIAIWFAPLAVFVIERSTLALVAAVILTTFVLWERPGLRDVETDSTPLLSRFPASLLIALLAQLTAAGLLADRLFPAIACALGAVILLFSQIRPPRRSAGTLFMMTCLALFLTLGGLSRFLRLGGGYENGQVTGSRDRAGDTTGVDASGGDYSGVIMFPEVETHVTLVPPLPFMNSELFSKKQTEPLTIPFYGAYWFFRYPARRPPPSSIVIRGSPEKKSFRSTGSVPMNMEAHQNLGKLVDVSCCSRIQIAVLNTDRYPGTVRLELILVNSSLPGEPRQTLGTQDVESRPGDASGGSSPMAETLTFPMPANPSIRQFDELSIGFRRARFREDRSARIAIERFVLIPRNR